MNLFVKILLFIAAVIALLMIIAMFVKKEYVVKREVTINKPAVEVFNYVKYIKNQESYNKWVMADANMRRTYKGNDGTVGFVSAWDSDNNNVGKGEQEITNIDEGKRIDLALRFEKPMENNGNAYMTTQALSLGQTKLNWVMQGSNKYPLNFMNLFIDKLLGPDLQTSLNNLKALLEKK